MKLCQKERSKPNPNLTIKALMEEKTEVFKRVASEAKDRQWKSFCDTLNRDTTLTSGNSTDRWKAVLRTPTPLTS